MVGYRIEAMAIALGLLTIYRCYVAWRLFTYRRNAPDVVKTFLVGLLLYSIVSQIWEASITGNREQAAIGIMAALVVYGAWFAYFHRSETVKRICVR